MAEVAVLKDKKLRKFLSGIDKRYIKVQKRQRDYVKLISILAFQDIMDHFDKEEGPNGKWPDFSDSYRLAVQGKIYFRKINGKTISFPGADPNGLPKKGSLGQMLVDSGKMRQRMAPIEKGRNFRSNKEGILWFNNSKSKSGFPYAAHHDTGPSDGKNPRSFMWFSSKGLGKVAEQSLAFLLEGK